MSLAAMCEYLTVTFPLVEQEVVPKEVVSSVGKEYVSSVVVEIVSSVANNVVAGGTMQNTKIKVVIGLIG